MNEAAIVVAIDLALALTRALAEHNIRMAELAREWEEAEAEGREVDVEKFRQRAIAARDRVKEKLGE